MGKLSAVREQEITQILAPWLRAKVENGLLKVWLAENAPEHQIGNQVILQAYK